MDLTYSTDFSYTHRNPYHDKLEEFGEMVHRDKDSENFQGKWNTQVFGRIAPIMVEIGTGSGHFMMEYSKNNPQVNFLGMDFRFKRSYKLAKRLNDLDNKNFRYLRARGERMAYIFAEDEVDTVFYFFPDPWPKKRHNKKRLFQTPFIECCHKVIKPGGKFYIKTDHDGYAEWMRDYIQQNQHLFRCTFQTNDLYLDAPDHFLASFQTGFEKIFLSQGVKIKAFVLESTKQDKEEYGASGSSSTN
jgi:tRNA (guanine-N7-)-methyltransferase